MWTCIPSSLGCDDMSGNSSSCWCPALVTVLIHFSWWIDLNWFQHFLSNVTPFSHRRLSFSVRYFLAVEHCRRTPQHHGHFEEMRRASSLLSFLPPIYCCTRTVTLSFWTLIIIHFTLLYLFINWFIKCRKVVAPEARFFPRDDWNHLCTRCTHLRTDGQAEWAWVAWINNWDGRPAKGHHLVQQ